MINIVVTSIKIEVCPCSVQSLFYISLFLGSICIGLAINHIGLDLSAVMSEKSHEHDSNSVWEILGSVIFTILIMWSYYRKYENSKPKPKSCCGGN